MISTHQRAPYNKIVDVSSTPEILLVSLVSSKSSDSDANQKSR